MKFLTILITSLFIAASIQAQDFAITTDSTTKTTTAFHQIALDLPFIGVMELESATYTFQQVTIPFQVPVSKKTKDRFALPEVDTLAAARRLDLKLESVLVKGDSLEVEG